jgi:hypothetical protein
MRHIARDVGVDSTDTVKRFASVTLRRAEDGRSMLNVARNVLHLMQT